MRARRMTFGLFAALTFAASAVDAKPFIVALTTDEEKRFLGIWKDAYFRRAEPWRMDLSNAAVPSIPLVFDLEIGEIMTPQRAVLTRETEMPDLRVPVASILRPAAFVEPSLCVHDLGVAVSGPLKIESIWRWRFDLIHTPPVNWGSPAFVVNKANDVSDVQD